MNRLCKLIATVFYIGYLPIAPGSIGSLVALFFYYFIKQDSYLVGASILVSLILGLLTARKAEELFELEDASQIIIDEFTGMLVSLYLLPPTMGYIVSAFLLFRFFDIIKPEPIKTLEKLKGSAGIMADDLMAGVYANLVLQAVYRLFH